MSFKIKRFIAAGLAVLLLASFPLQAAAEYEELKVSAISNATVVSNASDENTNEESPEAGTEEISSSDASREEEILLPENTPTPGNSEISESEPIATPEATATPAPTATPKPTATPEATATPEPTATPQLADEKIVELFENWQVQERVDEIVGSAANIGWMSEEELRQLSQEIRGFQNALKQGLNDSQRVELEEELNRLENAAASVQEMCNVWDALHNGTLSELEQSGKENSWRYQNGSLIQSGDAVPYADLQLQSETGNYWGIDVSHHQGKIDWDAVKAAGIDFAIIRCGFGSDYSDQDDSRWRENVEACERLGIPYGVYLYSYATSLDQARSEAAHALRLLQGTSPSLPVFIDLEEPRTQVLGGEMITQIANTFCSILDQNGYAAGVYASLSWWQYYFQDWFTSNPNYYHWIAHWSSSCGYDGRYEAWQYSNAGSVSGINGRVDLNYWYGASLDVYEDAEFRVYAPIFDYEYYVSNNPDLAGMNRNEALNHFLTRGMIEGRQACADFNVYIYRARYSDLYNAFGNDLTQYYLHYVVSGKNEGRTARLTDPYQHLTVYQGVDYSAVYNYEDYLSKNPDVAQAVGKNDYLALEHFVVRGMMEGRCASKEFDVRAYQNRYSDLRDVYGANWLNLFQHYLYVGRYEGRTARDTDPTYPTTVYNNVDYSSIYDFDTYLNNNSDIKTAFGNDDEKAIEHFVNCGISEGRIASDRFNVYTYRAKYQDLYQTFGSDLSAYYKHYMENGRYEGRTAGSWEGSLHITVYQGVDYSLVYDYDVYMAENPDVAQIAGRDDYMALEHFVARGMMEGRVSSNVFNVKTYRQKYDDLNMAFGDDWKLYFEHFMNVGVYEGRNTEQ